MAVGGSELAPHMGQRKTKPPLCSRNNADWMPLNFMPCRVLGCPAGLRASCPPGCPPRAALRPLSKQRCPILQLRILRGLTAAQVAPAVGSPPSSKCTRGGGSRCAPPLDGCVPPVVAECFSCAILLPVFTCIAVAAVFITFLPVSLCPLSVALRCLCPAAFFEHA